MINKKRIVNFSNNKLVDDNKDIILDTTSDDNLLVSSNTHITENININTDGNILINNTPKVFPIKPSNVNSGHYLKVNSTGTDLEFDNLSGHLIQTKFTFFNKSFIGNSLANTVNEIALPFSVTIKPNSVNSKILISTAVNYSSHDNGRFYKFLLYRSDDNGSTYNVINESMNDHHNYFKKSFMTSNWGGDADNFHHLQLSNNVNEYLDIANTTNPIIYKLYCHSESGNIDNTRIFTINFPYSNNDDYRNYRPEPTSYIMAQEIFYPNPMTYIKNSINYRSYTFTESSTFTLDKASYCDYLIVAGGGAGAGPNNEGGGGGAGGVVYRENMLFNSGTYNITVGSGGIATNGTTATSGGNSIISNLSSNNQARGGGSGDINETGGGVDGGSGGGGSHHGTTNTIRSSGLKIDNTSADKITYQTLASGGIITTYTDNNIFYVVHTFLSSGTFTTNSNIANIDYLIVAGGGGGSGPISGSNEGAGGGGGGLIYRTGITMNGTYNIVVGSGGNGGYQNAQTNGGNSSISGLDTALGGGGGAGRRDDGGTNDNGADGGSGGGGRHYGGVGGNAIASSGSPTENSTTPNEVGVFGNDGGSNDPSGYSNYNNFGAGGGGAGARGYHNNESLSTNRGVGGIGKEYSIRDGSFYYYAGGGGGGRHNPAAAGGAGGGGAGNSSYDNNAVSGTANTGGGGGGGSQGSPYTNPAGDGGSGIVIIRYSTTPINLINNVGEFGNDGGCKNFWSSGSEIDNSTVGGGGGAGEIGYDGNGTDHSTNSTNIILGSEKLRGKGGDGKIYNIRDGETQLYYGGGGGGGRSYGGGVGGKGGGGHGANPEDNEAREGKSATRNSGGGGGGGCNATGGNGGSGIVIIGVRE